MLTELGFAGGRVRLSPRVDEPMDLAHEDMEVGATLLLYGHGLEEEIHQHGLAASNRPPQVDPALALRLAKDRLQPAATSGADQIGFEADERAQACALGGIGPDLARGDSGVIGVLQR